MKALVALAFILLPMSAADDPGGWSNARWGMTSTQLLTSFGSEAVKLDPPIKFGTSYESLVRITEAQNKLYRMSGRPEVPLPKPEDSHQVDIKLSVPFKLANVDFRALLVPDAAGRLDKVRLEPTHDADGNESLFEAISQFLVQKYGRPWATTERYSTERQWTMPTTIITLTLARLPLTRSVSVTVLYEKRSTQRL